ncbi:MULTISPECIES: cell envelope integrity protein CreD [unclassified Pseudoxanthomonas]|uniref:cell envelope integrity protein CreD n=1 Tax=unclassified Pseudoxanthomonas TaxID=2645906 RepID=UPI00307897B7
MKSLRLLLRFLTIGGLVLLLLIPLMMIRGTISDRERYRAQAVERVSQSMAGPQQVVGPLRVVPWRAVRKVNATNADGQPEIRDEVTEGYVYQTPKRLSIDGGLKPDKRRIGLYDVRVFQLKAKIKAEFDALPFTEVSGRVYGDPYVVLGVADVRGFVGTPTLKMDGTPLALEAGTGAMADRMGGMHAMLAKSEIALPSSRLEMDLTLAGTQSLGIAPLGDSNHIALHSAWPHPLFGGRFLPNDRKIGADGFSASWEISSLASAAQSQLATKTGKLTRRDSSAYAETMPSDEPNNSALDSVDISLVDPVDVYTQADRASKYGILFVVLTFVGFALFELIKRLPIHPLQYLLVGLALAIFFLLLLSLSEHIDFWKAYLISAVACIGLQFVYLSGVLKSWLRAAGFATMLTALYGVLYGLLVSEDNALLMGSLMLFGILAVIMWVTRKVDWYDLSASLR